ncbi:hypothetical protein HAX42_09230 [Enterococcus casseliflavus]|nr:hypothetical protein [Enterococcus casseliflavus]
METLKGNLTYLFKRLVIYSVLFIPIKVNGSEQSHATFQVENVGPIEQSGGQISGSFPSTNELNNVSLIFLGVLLLFLSVRFMKLKKGSLYEK